VSTRCPPTLLTLLTRALAEHGLVPKGATVLVAASGGPDSTALLHGLARLAAQQGFRVLGAGIDHGLRPEAAAELGLAARVAEGANVPFFARHLTISPGGNLQARARTARHTALVALAEEHGASRIATGHTADDRAETLLLRLLRGAGPRGLAVLPPEAPSPVPAPPTLRLIRPLFRARRSDVLAHLTRHGLPFASDPSNQDPRFLRSRVRAELMPLLVDLAPGIVPHLGHLADMLAHEVDDPELSDLGRAQRLALLDAARRGHDSVTLRLAGGRDRAVRTPRRGTGAQ
jgi:tRNA(Ile)-lysidine synthase